MGAEASEDETGAWYLLCDADPHVKEGIVTLLYRKVMHVRCMQDFSGSFIRPFNFIELNSCACLILQKRHRFDST